MKSRLRTTGIRFCVALLAPIVICCFPGTTSNAQTNLSDFLTFDGPQHTPGGVPFQGGGEDKLSDDSLTAFFDVDNSMGMSVGDIFVGMVTLSEINASGQPSEPVGSNSQIAIVSSTTITGPGSVADSFAFGPTAAASSLSLQNLFGAVPGVEGNIDPNSIGLVFSTAMNDASANANDPSGSNDPLNWAFANIAGNFGVAGAGGWAWEATVGITPGTGDFAELLAGAIPFTGTRRAGITIESTAFNVDDWLPVDVLDFAGIAHLADFTSDISTFTPASQDEMIRGWTLRGHGSFFVNGLTTKTNIIPPEQLSILRGFQISGDLADTFESDDSYLKFNPGITLSATEPPVWLEFEGTLPSENPASLTVTLEASANTVGLTQTIDAFDWNTGQYEQVDARAAAFNNDSVVTVDLTANIADYIETGSGAVKTRTGWRPTGPILLFPWTVCIDQVIWTVTE